MALEAYERAEALGQGAVARNGRANVLKQLGRLDEALEVYEATIRERPENAYARCGRAEVLKDLGRLEEALEAYEATIRERPENVVARDGRAEVLKDLGRLEEALEAYEATIRERPEAVVARCGRAEVLKQLGRLDEALEAYEATIRERPENAYARCGRASVLAAIQRYEEALAGLPAQNPVTEQDWIGYHIRGRKRQPPSLSMVWHTILVPRARTISALLSQRFGSNRRGTRTPFTFCPRFTHLGCTHLQRSLRFTPWVLRGREGKLQST